MPVPRDAVVSAYRLILGADSPDEQAITFHQQAYNSLDELRFAFMRTSQAKKAFALANGMSAYSIPPFLLRPPARPEVEWLFETPNLLSPVCQLCTADQMESEDYKRLCMKLGFNPDGKHRKAWEFVYILAVLRANGSLLPGNRAVGFGTGSEPLPSLLAGMGIDVTATDAPADNLGYQDTRQWTSNIEDLFHKNLVSRQMFNDHVNFIPADMNNIPRTLTDFDFCWSACCLEHLGSIKHGLDFIRNSLETLRPGGIAVHTTEFNLQSNDETFETPGCSLFRKRDFEALAYELGLLGHRMEPLNFWPGAAPADEHIDAPPWGSPHLKLELQGWVTTSIGITVTKGSNGPTKTA